MATCKNTTTSSGVFTAIQNLVNETPAPAIVSVSYGECEAANGAASNLAFLDAYQQGAAEGVSIFVSAGDLNAAGCDEGRTHAVSGVGVSGLASTPYNVAVGGTDFADSFVGLSSSYWSANNTAAFGSALSYVPEIPWNDSCASELVGLYAGYSTTYGSSGSCNNLSSTYLDLVGGSGGPSGCATGAPASGDVVGGTCAGYAKPSWQSGVLGNPSDGVRDLPDVSFFASNGIWGHYYVFCYSDPTSGRGGAACSGAPSGWSGAGGTSFASPIMAGVQALINQQTGSRQGNPNTRLYELATAQYGLSPSGCDSNNGFFVDSKCVFNDVTLGDNDVPCSGAANCYRPSGPYGVMSTSDTSYLPAYGSNKGWDFTAGLGSVNVNSLVSNWSAAQTHWFEAGVGDFNGDGFSDVLGRAYNGNMQIWLVHGATATPTIVAQQNVAAGWSVAGVGDFNGDGISDILWRYTDGSVMIWLMNADGSTQSSTNLGPVPLSQAIVGVGLFNADKYADILWRNADGSLVIWEMSGAAVLNTVAITEVLPPTWTVLGVGDFNGDGVSDILWRYVDGSVAVWLMNNTPEVKAQGASIALSLDYSFAGLGDFNKDKYADILWRNADGTILIWEMKSTKMLAAVGPQPPQANSFITAVGDFNGDGYADILWRNSASELVIAWFMQNGVTQTTSTYAASPP